MSEKQKRFRHEGDKYIIEYTPQGDLLNLFEKTPKGEVTVFRSVPCSALKKIWERGV